MQQYKIASFVSIILLVVASVQALLLQQSFELFKGLHEENNYSTRKGSIYEIIKEKTEFKLAHRIIKKHPDIVLMLKKSNEREQQHLTMFVPTNEAIRKLLKMKFMPVLANPLSTSEERQEANCWIGQFSENSSIKDSSLVANALQYTLPEDEHHCRMVHKAILYHLTMDKNVFSKLKKDEALLTTLNYDRGINRQQLLKTFAPMFATPSQPTFTIGHDLSKAEGKSNSFKGDNGDVFAIDSVIIPPPLLIRVLDRIPASIPELQDLKTFSDALIYTGLSKIVSDSLALTLFVPSEEAWKRVPPTVKDFLLSPLGAPALKALLLYHMVPPQRESNYSPVYTSCFQEDEAMMHNESLPNTPKVLKLSTMFDMRQITLIPTRSFITEKVSILIKDASNSVPTRTLFTDFLGFNGVIHVIDNILVPFASFGQQNEQENKWKNFLLSFNEWTQQQE